MKVQKYFQQIKMAFKIQNILLITVICHAANGKDDNKERDKSRLIAAICVSGVIFVFFIILIIVCCIQQSSKRYQGGKPWRRNVVGLRRRAVPPTRVMPSVPSRPTTSYVIAPIDPPPYYLFEHGYFKPMESRNTNNLRDPLRHETSTHDRHQAIIECQTTSQDPHTIHFHQQQPPPYSE